jgi:NTE family protein
MTSSLLARLRHFGRRAAEGWRRPRAGAEGTQEERRVILVLSGGGLRGLVHVGAWRALLEEGIRPDVIVGTSIGALVGAAAAAGADWDQVEQAARSVVRKEIAALDRRVLLLNGVRRPALFRGEVLRRYMEGLIPVRSFQDLVVPLQVNAVNLGTGEMRWFGSPVGGEEVDPTADLLDAVWASSAVPTFYAPVEIDGSFYVDGGILDTFALRRAAVLGATWILAIDATTEGVGEDPADLIDEGMLAINERVFGIVSGARRRAVLESWSGPPLTIVRPAAGHIPAFDFDFNDYLVDEGYQATRDALSGPEAARHLGTATRALRAS